MNDLNLLPNVAKFQASKIKLKIMARKASIGIGIIWVATIVMVFGIWFVFTKRVETEQNRYNLALDDFESLKSEILLTQQLKVKAKLVSQILEERFEYSSAFLMMKTLFSEDVKLANTEIKDRNTINITAVAPSVDGFNEVETKIAMANSGMIDRVSAIKIKSLAYEDTGWNFSLEVLLK